METMILSLETNIRNQSVVLTRIHEHPRKMHDEDTPSVGDMPESEAYDASVNSPGKADYASVVDAQLLSFVASGNCEALEELYDRYVKACYGLALSVVVDPYIAEEVVQDVFFKLWAAPFSYVPERGKFSVWLLTLVHNRSIDRLRREKHTMPAGSVAFDAEDTGGVTFADMLSDGANTPYEEAWRKEQGRVVRRALWLLPARQREVISLAYLRGLTQREIAQRLGVPLGTIKSRTQHGLLQLRSLLDGEKLLEDTA